MAADPVYLGVLFLAHATCSVSMVLLNKTIAQGFDFPWTVVLIQNCGTMVIGFLHSCLCTSRTQRAEDSSRELESGLPPHRRILGMKVPRKLRNRALVLVQVVLFMSMLFMSLKALRFISVPLYVVARNTVPAQTALLERVISGVRLSASAVLGLSCTVVGAVLYTYGDQHGVFALSGMVYACLLTVMVSGTSVVDKMTVRALSQEEEITPVEVNQIRVALSMPLNLLFVLAIDLGHGQVSHSSNSIVGGAAPEAGMYAALQSMPTPVLASLLVSTLFGFGIGTFNFYLQQVVSAATVQVANILYKLCTTLLSLVTHPVPVSNLSWMGYSVSLAGIALYTFGPELSLASLLHRATKEVELAARTKSGSKE